MFSPTRRRPLLAAAWFAAAAAMTSCQAFHCGGRENVPSFGPPALPCATWTTEAASPTTRFAVIGDYGYGGANERSVADLVKRWKPAFILTTGDNNYPRGQAATIDANIGAFYHEFIGPYLGAFGCSADRNR